MLHVCSSSRTVHPALDNEWQPFVREKYRFWSTVPHVLQTTIIAIECTANGYSRLHLIHY